MRILHSKLDLGCFQCTGWLWNGFGYYNGFFIEISLFKRTYEYNRSFEILLTYNKGIAWVNCDKGIRLKPCYFFHYPYLS